ncbi:hypothetical protein IJO12_08240 [bacterium]|nr:hypothetical protein [bacterium]
MKEQDFIKIIQRQTESTYLGDDCAYLQDLGIVITQDNFLEDVHFRTDWATPFQIGYKAVSVNISDVLASGAKPAYISVGLSLPNVNDKFIEELYRGIEFGAMGAEIIGGDITGADKIFISITAIGKTDGRNISSRKFAFPGYIIISPNCEFGRSSKGLDELKNGIKYSENIKHHLEPVLDCNFSAEIATLVKEQYAMMDTSDGLADALFQIAKASEVSIVTPKISGAFGAEDYKLVAAIPEKYLNHFGNYQILGSVNDYQGYYLKMGDDIYLDYDELNLYNHFEV